MTLSPMDIYCAFNHSFYCCFLRQKARQERQSERAQREELDNTRMDFARSQINNKKDTSGFIKFGPGGEMFFDELCSL